MTAIDAARSADNSADGPATVEADVADPVDATRLVDVDVANGGAPIERPSLVPGHRRVLRWAGRLAFFVPAFCLFVVALGLMKTGATALAPTLDGSIFTDNLAGVLGLGWLGACIVLSGSPVATASLTLLDGGALERGESLVMLVGSRLGASFVVLVVGFFFAIRKRRGDGRKVPLTVGVMSLLMTALAYLPGAVLAGIFLSSGALDGVRIDGTPRLLETTGAVSDWTVELLQRFLPDAALFPIGLLVLLVAFKLFDSVLPDPKHEREVIQERANAWYHKTWPMFVVGGAVTLMTLSVAVSLTVLIPLVAKGYLDHEDALPYAAGANITTLADTMVAAILLGNAEGIQVVLAALIAVTIWTLVMLKFLYRWVRPAIVRATWSVLSSRPTVATFTVVLLIVPMVLIAL
ncbi:MAG: hypothetical protein ACRD29_21370 [Acidimicrobiales bacterium]